MKIVYLELDSYVTLMVAFSGGLAGVLSPLTGFIADLYVGQYRCIVFGLASVWAVLLACWVLTLLRFVPLKSLIFVGVVTCLCTVKDAIYVPITHCYLRCSKCHVFPEEDIIIVSIVTPLGVLSCMEYYSVYI